MPTEVNSSFGELVKGLSVEVSVETFVGMTTRLAGNFQGHVLIGQGKLMYALLGSPHNSSWVAFCLFDIFCPDG